MCDAARTVSGASFILTAMVEPPGSFRGGSRQSFEVNRMKTAPVNGTPRFGTAQHARDAQLHGVLPHASVNAAIPGLQRALAQVKNLQQALASIQEDALAVRQEAALLAETNARLLETAARREAEVEKVRHFAYHDELTGLPNRALLLDRLQQALVRAKRQQTHLALLFLDLDGFKAVNDRLGHAAGDKLLQRVAERLLSCIRGGDTACRYGGDEFVLLLPEVDDEKHAVAVAQKIHARLARSYRVDDCSIAVTASIGVAVYPVDGASRSDLINRADGAMYHAKTFKRSSQAPARMVKSR
jgi:diguanylate cyclase (GGDEF)-like protein